MPLELLPDSRPKETKRVTAFRGLNWVPIFCANCGADGGWVPEENCTFAFYLCDPCAVRHGKIDGTYMVPDEAFFEKVKEAQVEKFGRVLTPQETADALGQEEHILSKLAKERPRR